MRLISLWHLYNFFYVQYLTKAEIKILTPYRFEDQGVSYRIRETMNCADKEKHLLRLGFLDLCQRQTQSSVFI